MLYYAEFKSNFDCQNWFLFENQISSENKWEIGPLCALLSCLSGSVIKILVKNYEALNQCRNGNFTFAGIVAIFY